MKERYTATAIVLHWAIALLVIGILTLGFYMVGIPKKTPDRGFYLNLHKSLGLLAAALILLRLAWRARHAPPPLPTTMSAWEVRAARWSHGLVLQPTTGYLSSSFNKFGVRFFGYALPHWGWEDAGLRGLILSVHQVTAILLVTLIALHLLAAVKHLLIDRDGVFARMLPWRWSGNR